MKLDHLQFILRYIYRIHFAIKSHFAIYILESSFKAGGSCINQRLSITHEIYHSMDEGYEIRGVFLDISKAFDKVWHEGLVFKLKQNGISDNLLNIFEEIENKESFLMGRHLIGKIFMQVFPKVLSWDHCYS